MLIRKTKKEKDPFNGLEFEESTEIWVADFGSDDLEKALRQEVPKLKPKSEASLSWIFISFALLIFVIISEMLIREIGLTNYFSEKKIFWLTWVWRLMVIVAWLTLARLRWLFSREKVFVISLISYTAAIIILGIIKIVYVRSAWAWLNLLVEPIWTALLILFLGSVFIKYSNKKLKIKN
ncbi:MAG: hypothetical protein PHO91_03915 [Patescibacteria group bacterium]|nr:hypothetical protein [Patescibacteria group bacterium]